MPLVLLESACRTYGGVLIAERVEPERTNSGSRVVVAFGISHERNVADGRVAVAIGVLI